MDGHRAAWAGRAAPQGTFDAVAIPAVVAAISELLGDTTWPAPFSWGDPLVTFPGREPWSVPTGGWHIDFPAGDTAGRRWS